MSGKENLGRHLGAELKAIGLPVESKQDAGPEHLVACGFIRELAPEEPVGYPGEEKRRQVGG